MTDSQLHKLHRQELLEILFEMRKEMDSLIEENKSLKKQLENKSELTEEILELVRETAEGVRSLRGESSREPLTDEASLENAEQCEVNGE